VLQNIGTIIASQPIDTLYRPIMSKLIPENTDPLDPNDPFLPYLQGLESEFWVQVLKDPKKNIDAINLEKVNYRPEFLVLLSHADDLVRSKTLQLIYSLKESTNFLYSLGKDLLVSLHDMKTQE